MKKPIAMLAGLCLSAAFAAAAHAQTPSGGAPPSGKDSAVLPDAKADNAGDKKAVKKATPKAKENAKAAADETKSKAGKDEAKSGSSSK